MIRKMYAEDFNQTVEEHRKTCIDPKCDEALVQKFPGLVQVMVREWVPDELFLTENGEPFISIPLLAAVAGDNIAIASKKAFDKNSKFVNTRGCPGTKEAFIESCDHKKVGFRLFPDSRIDLVCGDMKCNKPIISVKVAPRPKVEMPFIFCDVHGKQLSYFICKHVLEGKEPLILDRAGVDAACGIGAAICGDKCDRIARSKTKYKKHEHEFAVICAGHLNDVLNGRLEQILKEVEETA